LIPSKVGDTKNHQERDHTKPGNAWNVGQGKETQGTWSKQVGEKIMLDPTTKKKKKISIIKIK
jgi:hypothetical protein